MTDQDDPPNADRLAMDLLQTMLRSIDAGNVLVDAASFAARRTGVPAGSVRASHAFIGAADEVSPALAEVLAAGTSILLASADAYRERYPLAEVPGECCGGALAVFAATSLFESPPAAISFAWDGPLDFDEDTIADLGSIAGIVARIYDRRRATEASRVAAQRSNQLADLARALASAQTVTEMLGFVASQAPVPVGASGAILGVIDRPRNVFRRYFAEILPEPMAQQYASEPLDSQMPMVRTAKTGERLLFASRDDVAASHPELLAAFEAGGFTAFATLPLRDRNGELFGSLGIGWAEPMAFDPPLLALLTTLTELVAQTLQRTQLAEDLARESERTNHLAKFAQRLTMASTPGAVQVAVIESLLAIDGVTSVACEWVDPEQAGPGDVVLGPPLIDLVARADDDRGHTVLALPATDGTVLGTVTVDWEPRPEVAPWAQDTIVVALELLTATMARIRLSNAEHEVIRDLQRRVLVTAPPVPGLEVATHYRPAESILAMAGDWFQTVALPEGRLGFVVGDMVGHGAAAAADMTQLSATIATLLRLGTPLEALFSVVEEAVTPLGMMATVVVGEIDPAAARLHYVSAGHPPLLLLGSGGSVSVLGDGRGPMVGVPSPPCPVGEAAFGPGDTLLAYTDGMIERRGEYLETGIARVADALASTRDLPVVDQLVDVVRLATEGAVLEDDLAAIAVRGVLP